ncbi:MAG: energy-coupled thiamine transporter ThiT [Lachnospiraceae bacterium]|nr:energy-coupled thiamine transporter ThiT [Lachnospiraceae bacterium]MBQ9605806.1 energy-coupled thiamine transporter ThiT [Lachnospiraceae bacterium]
MSLFLEKAEDGSFALTNTGELAIVVIIALLLIAIGFIGNKKKKFSAKRLAFCAASLAIAFILSNIRLWRMPWGGSVTLCSMFFVTLIGSWYGTGTGIMAGFVFGCMNFLQGGGTYILDPLQACLDYILAYTALGLSGLFCNKKHGVEIGYIVGVTVRGLLNALGGYIYWMDYMPENFPESLAVVYPILYNFAYIIPEMVITLIVIQIPAVKKALSRIRETALSSN